MRYCVRCTMPDTRPGITFDNNGLCSACQNYDMQKQINWNERWKEFEKLCDKYRNCNGEGNFDCAIAVSGGKDSHYQVHMMKEVMHMTPILFSVEDNFPMTEAGAHNIRNICEEFGCPIIRFKPNIKAQKILTRAMFENYGKPTWYIDRYLYTYPLHMALKFNTMLLVYGENVSYTYGGDVDEDTYSARNQVLNGVASDYSFEELMSYGVDKADLTMIDVPSKELLEKLDPIYLSYFVPWNSVKNYEFAKGRGFRDLTHEWIRTHHIENYDQIDSRGYLVHSWMKYPKFGHGSTTDYTSRYIRYGIMKREEAIELVKKHDHLLDPKCVQDFCDFCGYKESEFWAIVDRHYNRDIFEKNDMGRWVLKEAIYDKNI